MEHAPNTNRLRPKGYKAARTGISGNMRTAPAQRSGAGTGTPLSPA